MIGDDKRVHLNESEKALIREYEDQATKENAKEDAERSAAMEIISLLRDSVEAGATFNFDNILADWDGTSEHLLALIKFDLLSGVFMYAFEDAGWNLFADHFNG